MIALNKLEDALQLESVEIRHKVAAKLILDAANDWPVTVESLDDFLGVLKKYIGEKLYFEEISTVSNKLDLTKDAWVAESLASLLELFSLFDQSLSLQEIFASVGRQFEVKTDQINGN